MVEISAKWAKQIFAKNHMETAKMKLQIIMLIPVVFIIGCAEHNARRANFDTLDNSLWSVKNTSPRQEARLAFKAGDKRLLGVMTWGYSLPGVPSQNYHAYDDKLGVRIIEGTSDMIGDEKTRELMEKSSWYAKAYNQEILRCLPIFESSILWRCGWE